MTKVINPLYVGYCVQLKHGSFVDKNGFLYQAPIPDKNMVNDLSWVTKRILEPAKECYPDGEPKLIKVRIGFTIEEVDNL